MTRVLTPDTNPSDLSENQQSEIQSLFENLIEKNKNYIHKNKSRRDYQYNLQFRSSSILGPNAFALPGGTIIVTDELIEDYGEPHIINAILAHEIGHVENQHSLRRLYRALGMATMITLITGDSGPMLEDLLLEGSALLSLSYSRNHEMQADDFSFSLLTHSKLQPDGLINFFEKLEEDIPLPEEGEWLMTHPLSQKRIDNVKSHLKNSDAEYDN